MEIKKAFIAIGFVLATHIVLLATNGYFVMQWVDMPMHLGGGLAMGLLGAAIWSVADTEKATQWAKILFIIGFVSFIGIMWEWHEYLLDAIIPQVQHTVAQRHQPGLDDTMADFAFDILGGLIALFFCKKVV